MTLVDEVLELLKDGKWHDIEETVKKLRLDAKVIQKITAFLAQYGFIQLDKDHRRARLSPQTIKLMKT